MVGCAVNADDKVAALSIALKALARLRCPIFQCRIKLDVGVDCCHELEDSEGWKLEGSDRNGLKKEYALRPAQLSCLVVRVGKFIMFISTDRRISTSLSVPPVVAPLVVLNEAGGMESLSGDIRKTYIFDSTSTSVNCDSEWPLDVHRGEGSKGGTDITILAGMRLTDNTMDIPN